MSEPWVCPSCQFEWVVEVGGTCLSCGYGSRPAVPGPEVVVGPVLGAVVPQRTDDPLAPLYAPGHYPAPVETPAVVNGAAAHQPGSLTAQRQAMLIGIMQTGRAKIEGLEGQVRDAAQAESMVRAELAQWQQEAERRWTSLQESQRQSREQQQQLVILAEENQRLRQAVDTLRQGLPDPPEHRSSRTIQPAGKHSPEDGYRLGQIEERQARHGKAIEALEQTVGQILEWMRGDAVRRQDQREDTSDAPEAYSTFITTDSQAARIEAEILRQQAQYGQGWRG